ncbi:MAG: hypothetical protein JXA42_03620 [Anaerolineales bacterium]|nr:hypothetical protein [Anaerolineales bacterium]
MKKSRYSQDIKDLLSIHAVPAGIEELVLALSGAGDEQLDEDCLRCQDRLHEYVDAVMMGEEKRDEWSWIRTHLLLCDSCGIQFGELIDVVMMQLEGDFLVIEPRTPDLSFLRMTE